MKILVATSSTQGARANDYNFCVDGELVWIQEPCDRGIREPDGGCGCGRGFAGAASHRATTTAMVTDSALTRAEVMLAFQTSLADGGWPISWYREVTEDNIGMAARFEVGTVVERRLDTVTARTLADY
jgi:hypothetical protein